MSLEKAKAITKLMDNQFEIFGFKFGLDPILGLFPGGGDLITLLLSAYIIKVGIDLKLPEEKITQMVVNVILDFVIGTVPLLGDVADVFYKANTKNIAIIEQHVKSKGNIEEGEIVNG